MTCNKYFQNKDVANCLFDQSLYFDEKGRFRKDFRDLVKVIVEPNPCRFSSGTIFDQYFYMLSVVDYLKDNRFLSFSKDDALYFCSRECDLSRGSLALAQGFGTSQFQFNRFFVRQYISLFKLDYDLFFSLYQYFLQDKCDDVCCDLFLKGDQPLVELVQNDILCEDIVQNVEVISGYNGNEGILCVDGENVVPGYQCFLQNVIQWKQDCESCLLTIHSGLRNCRGDLVFYKFVCDPWEDYNVCFSSLSSLLQYQGCRFKGFDLNVDIMVFDYTKSDFLITIEDNKGFVSLHPIAFKHNGYVRHKVRLKDFKKRFSLMVSTTSFLGAYQISYTFSLLFFFEEKKMKRNHKVDYCPLRTFSSYDFFEKDLPYDYKILYYDVLGDNGYSFCRPITSVRSNLQQQRYVFSSFWRLCGSFLPAHCFYCGGWNGSIMTLNCGHDICDFCIYHVTRGYKNDYVKCFVCMSSFYYSSALLKIEYDFVGYNCGVCFERYCFISNEIMKFPQFFLQKHDFIDAEYLERYGCDDIWVCYHCKVAKAELCYSCRSYKIYIFHSIERLGFEAVDRVQCYSCFRHKVHDVVEKKCMGSSY